MSRRLRIAGELCFAVLLCCAAPAVLGDTYPTKAIRYVVPYPPGGSTDILTRIVGQKLTESWGQQVVVDNRGGASGIIGAELVAKSAPDGYTLLMTASGPHAINPSLYRKLPYDSLKDFAPVTLVAKLPMLLLAHPSVPVDSAKDLLALLKSRRGSFVYASIGNGTPSHLAMELLKSMAGVEVVHIPYKGSGPALVALVGGQEASVMFDSVLSSYPHVKSGKLKALAVSTEQRLPALPSLPTVAESALPGYEAYTWTATVAPAGVPPSTVQKLSREIARIVQMPDVREKLEGQGAVPVGNTPEQFSAFAKAEIAKWGKVIRDANVHVD